MSVCESCGWTFSGKYCPKCGTEYVSDEFFDDFSEVTLYSENDEDREAKARRNLWAAMHERHTDEEKCQSFARELKSFAPEDYYADFAETVLVGDDKSVSRFLNGSSAADIEMYADAVLDFLCDRMTVGLYYSVVGYRDRSSLKNSAKYDEAIERCTPDAVIRQREKEYELRRERESVERLEKENPGTYKRCVKVFTAKVLFSCISVCLFLAMLVTLFVGLLYIADVGDIVIYIVLASVVAALFAVSLAMHISEIVGVRRNGLMSPDDACSLTSVWVLMGVTSACAACSMIFWILDLAYDPGDFPFAGFVTIFVLSLAVLAYGIILSVSVRRLRGDMNRAVGAYGTGGHKSIVAEAKIYAYGVTGSSKGHLSAADTMRGVFTSRLFYIVVLAIVVVAVIMFFTIRSTSSLYNKQRVIGGYNLGRDNGYIEELLGCPVEVYSDKLGEPSLETDDAWYWYDDTLGETYDFVMVTFEGKDKSVTSVFLDKNHVYDETDDFSSTVKEVSRVSFSKDSVRLRYEKTMGGNNVYGLYDTVAYAVEYKDGSYFATYLSDYTLTTTSLSTCVVEWSDRLGSYSSSVPLVSNYVVDEKGVLTYVYTIDGVINVPEDVTSIADDALVGVTYIKEIILPSAVKSIVIPNTVTTLEDGAFSGCEYLESVTLNGGSTSAYMFSGCDSLTDLVIGGEVDEIADYAFYCISTLKSVTIGENVATIGAYAFYRCTTIESIYYNAVDVADLPKKNYTFYKVGEDGDGITLTIGASVAKIPDYLFSTYYYYNKKTTYYVPNITDVAFADGCGCTIESHSFYECTTIKMVHISDMASWCGIEFVSAKSNPLYYSGKLYLNDELITDLVIPEGVEQINDYLFYNCTNLSSVTMLDGLVTIGKYAFYGCESIVEAYIPESVSNIESHAFEGCSSLMSITIPETLTLIEDYTFRNCSSLTSIVIPDGVTSIGAYAFYGCRTLSSIDLGSAVTLIGESAFQSCRSLTAIDIPDSVNRINASAFYACGLTSVTIPDSVTYMGSSVFSNSDLLTAYIGTGVTSIAKKAFCFCHSLESIVIGENVTTIWDSAFQYCSSLNTLTIGKALKNIYTDAFWGDTIRTVYYEGSKTDWSNISKSNNYSDFSLAKFYYNCSI